MKSVDGGAPTHPLQPAADASRTDREASLDALQALEAALSAPTPGREDTWLGTVVTALDALAEALDTQAIGDAETASLLSEVAADQPRLLPRIDRLRHEHRDLREAVASLPDRKPPPSRFRPAFRRWRCTRAPYVGRRVGTAGSSPDGQSPTPRLMLTAS